MRLFIKRIILFLVPFFFVVGIFVCLDIFKIFWNYDNYYKGTIVGINRCHVSTMVYVNQKDKYDYDSFIFGNSRSIAFYGDEWKKYISSGSSVFHFDASGGCVSGLYEKIKYIDEHNGKLKNALLILDHDLLERTEQTGYLFRSSPILVDNSNIFSFLQEHFHAFTTFEFLYALCDYNITHKYKDYMGNFINPREIVWKKETNEIRWDNHEKEILSGNYYTPERIKGFENSQHPDSLSFPVINDERKIYLQKIAEILKKHHTSYKIIISPIYDQIKLNNDDLQFLASTFGQEHVYDFSGPNRWNSDIHNFYETSHFRPCVANDVLRMVYNKDN